jgi:hypothetical protein
MAPKIPTGSLAMAQRTPTADIRIGDVISFETSQGIRITHRVARMATVNGNPALITKGDSNATEDVVPVVAPTVDREFLAVPGLGYVVNAVLQPQWSFAGGALVGLAVAFSWLKGREPGSTAEPSVRPERGTPRRALRSALSGFAARSGRILRLRGLRKGERSGKRAAATGATLVAALAVIAAGTLAAPSPTAAAFTDFASSSGSPSLFGASRLPAAPTALTCSFDPVAGAATLSWTPPWGSVTSYAVRVTAASTTVYSGTAAAAPTSFSPGAAPSGTWTITVTPTNTYGTGAALSATATYTASTSLTC